MPDASMGAISQILAPWMAQNPFDMSQYGGQGQFGLDLLSAAATPTPYRVPFAAALGRAMQQGQQSAMANAQARMGLAGNSLGLQQQLAMMPFMIARMRQRAIESGALSPQNGEAGATASGSAPATPSAPAASTPFALWVVPGAGAQAPNPPPPSAPAQVSPGARSDTAMAGVPRAPWQSELDDADLAGDLALMRGDPQGLLDAARLRLQYDPAALTAAKLASSDLAADNARVAAAEAARDPQAYIRAYIKRATDAAQLHSASMSGNVTGFGLPAWVMQSMANYNPSSGKFTANGRQQLIPGAAGTEQALEAARATGEAAGQVEEVTRADGSKVFVPRSALLGSGALGSTLSRAPGGPPVGRSPIAQAPVRGPVAVPGNVAGLSPSTTTMLEGNAKNALEANSEYQIQAEAGQQMLVQTQELRNAAADFTPGQFAESRMKMLQYLNSSGLITPEYMKSLGSAQAGQKIAIQLQAAATKQLGSREAAQIFTYMGKSLPNLTLSVNGLAKVSGYMDGIARYNIARADLAQQRSAANDANGVNNVRNDFIRNSNPLYFVVASSPPPIQREIIQAMGAQAQKFLSQWNAAARAGWAPRPGQYWSGNGASAGP